MSGADERRPYASRGTGLDWDGRLGERGAGSVIEDGVRIFHPENVRLGRGVYVGHGAQIDGYHSGRVAIGDGSWIGAGARILGGVQIGRGCVVAAGAVVTRSVPDNTLVAGVPAVPKRSLADA